MLCPLSSGVVESRLASLTSVRKIATESASTFTVTMMDRLVGYLVLSRVSSFATIQGLATLILATQLTLQRDWR